MAEKPLPGEIKRMFNRISLRYRLLNSLISLGRDSHWRRMAVSRTDLRPGERLLDIGAGTGDLSAEVLRRFPAVQVVAADFSSQMLAAGRKAFPSPRITWQVADALNLPFADNSFASVISAFLIRNVADRTRALKEQWRVLKPGRRLVFLETAVPRIGSFAWRFSRFYLKYVIPFLGRFIARDEEAYLYLARSTSAFLPPPQVRDLLCTVGFTDVRIKMLMLGHIALYSATKPGSGEKS